MNNKDRYLQGWNASKRTRTYDLDKAETRHERKYGRDTDAMFAAGWADYAAGYKKFTSYREGKKQ